MPVTSDAGGIVLDTVVTSLNYTGSNEDVSFYLGICQEVEIAPGCRDSVPTSQIFTREKTSSDMEISGYEFEGVFTDFDQIPSGDRGVNVVLCLIEERPHCVLYIGTSEGGRDGTQETRAIRN